MKTDNSIALYLSRHETEMFALLRDMVRIQSHSRNKEGVDEVGRFIERAVDGHFLCEFVKNEIYGNHLLVRSQAEEYAGKQVLLVGHMDTVFPKDTDFRNYGEDADCAYGPGVIDMKGGIVAGLYAMRALAAGGVLDRIPLTFILNSDEEIGSVSSRELIREEAAKSAFAFVLEAGGLDGGVVTGRKGNLSAVLRITGRSGHAAFAPKDKGSAILELAHKVIRLEKLNHPERGVTVNVGLVRGGIGPNTVPESAEALIDFRYPDADAASALEKELQGISSASSSSHAAIEFEVLTSRPAMPASSANRGLFRHVERVAQELGIVVSEEFRQGVSDANLIAEQAIPVLDGLGPIGAKDHSAEEYMRKDSLLQRATLLSHAIQACWEAYLQEAMGE